MEGSLKHLSGSLPFSMHDIAAIEAQKVQGNLNSRKIIHRFLDQDLKP